MLQTSFIKFFHPITPGDPGDTSIFPELLNLKKFLTEARDVLYLGDSVLLTNSTTDTDKRLIPEILQALSPKCKIGTIAHPVYHLDLYYYFIKMIMKHDFKGTIIVPINIRSFSTEWNDRPEYSFDREKFLIYASTVSFGNVLKAFYFPLQVLKGFDLFKMSEAQFLKTTVYNWDKPVGDVSYFENGDRFRTVSDNNMRDKLIYHYMNPLKLTAPRLASLKKIIKLTQNSQTKIVFYITPVDYQTGIRYLGKEFDERIEKNLSRFRDLADSEGTTILDFSHSLVQNGFIWKDNLYPNEHLSDLGRNFVADALFKQLKKNNLNCLKYTSSTPEYMISDDRQ